MNSIYICISLIFDYLVQLFFALSFFFFVLLRGEERKKKKK